MIKETRNLTIKIPQNLWQSLAALAAQDMRTEEEFLLWLIYKEFRNRNSENSYLNTIKNEVNQIKDHQED